MTSRGMRPVVFALCLLAVAASKPKTAADWRKVVDEKLGDVDAAWTSKDDPADVATDDDELLRQMELRRQAGPDITTLDDK